MERFKLLLLILISTLSFYYLRVESEGSLFVGKLQVSCSVEEREALHNFKQSLSDPHHFLSNWESSENCCTWTGVGCSNTTGHVIKLDFNRMSLQATSLVPSLFRLQHLQYLNFDSIFFNYTRFPQSISSLTNLRHLDLSYSGFVGVIPPQLGNLTKLRYLDLSRNFLAASNLPWISHFSSLQYLDLSFVNLTLATNWLHEIKMLPALSTLKLSGCNLQVLPTSLPSSNFSSIINTFDISFNQFPNSTIPSWLSNMTTLFELDLYDCQLQGMITNSPLGALHNLRSLDISDNFIGGSIPQRIGKMINLTYLDLGNNRLSGSIPKSLGQLMNLRHLNLGINLLQDSLSEVNFANLSQLNYLVLSNNSLDFNMISINWVPPFQLFALYLSSCPIGPHFPLWIQTQKFLDVLDLSNSSISDIIPSWFWSHFSEVHYLDISHNQIRGELPMFWNISSFDVTIDLRSNFFEGHLPQILCSLGIVLFSNNKFSHGIEWFLNSSIYFWAVDLSHNQLSGEISDSICRMPSLVLLDLSHNNLSGEIPKCQGNFSSFMTLEFISLANNNFWGSIPQWIGNLPNIQSLYLSNNNFQGEIPFLTNCNELIILSLGQNKLTGNIPSWIGDRLLSLKILSLRSNKFYGLIPSELSKLKELQILDLAENFLSGPLPKSFKFLNSMTLPNKSLEPMIPSTLGYHEVIFFADSLIIDIKGMQREFTSILSLVMIMDLSSNNLNEEVPIELMSLYGLRSLNLSRNQFTGHIPINIGVMQSLESLDLSRNHLSGEIPKSIVNLSGLEQLDLSYNQLSGRIPVGAQLNTFDESSYYGNLDLCGKPLLKTCEHDDGSFASPYNIHYDDDNFGLFLGMGLGFAVGLWSVLGTLLLKRSWAIAYFKLYDNMINNIYVYVVVNVNGWFNK